MCCYCTKKLNSFEQAYRFQKRNTLVHDIYVITVPLVQIIEYILVETDNYKFGKFKITYISRVYIMVFTITMLVFLQSFSMSFNKILPFVPFKKQIQTVLLMQGMYNLIGSIIRLVDAEIGPYDGFETYQLLFICVYSIILMMFTLLQF